MERWLILIPRGLCILADYFHFWDNKFCSCLNKITGHISCPFSSFLFNMFFSQLNALLVDLIA